MHRTGYVRTLAAVAATLAATPAAGVTPSFTPLGELPGGNDER